MDLYLQGKTAIVSGASQGLGRAIATTLAAEGVRVFATARNVELLESLKQEIVDAGGPEPIVFVQDFLPEDAGAKIADAAHEAFGHIDIIVNNAGASYPVNITAPEEIWKEAIALNFDGHRRLTERLLPQMIERKSGSILNITGTAEPMNVNIGSIGAAAMTNWSKGLSRDLGKYGITSNCIQPGLLDTAQIRRIFPGDERRKFAEREISLGDFGEPQDVGNMAAFLVSGRARYVTGTVVVVDGGMRHYAF